MLFWCYRIGCQWDFLASLLLLVWKCTAYRKDHIFTPSLHTTWHKAVLVQKKRQETPAACGLNNCVSSSDQAATIHCEWCPHQKIQNADSKSFSQCLAQETLLDLIDDYSPYVLQLNSSTQQLNSRVWYLSFTRDHNWSQGYRCIHLQH